MQHAKYRGEIIYSEEKGEVNLKQCLLFADAVIFIKGDP